MVQDLNYPTPVVDSVNPVPSPTTISSNTEEDNYQPYDDRQPFHEGIAEALLAPRVETLTPLPQKTRLSTARASFHRRANTEVIRRQSHLSVKQLFADQPITFEDLDNGDRSSNLPTENIARKKLEEGARLISGWFQGKSEMVHHPAEQESSGMASPSTAFPDRAQKRQTPTSPLKQVTSSGTFPFFGLKPQGECQPELPEPAEDEFLNMDITAALLPPETSDLGGQHAFDVLLKNADNVLRRLQAAYKQRTFALHEALADKNENQEELEETRTRVGHLKVQLDGMAEKVLQQEKSIKAMAEELEAERQLRQREEESRRRSVTLIRSGDDDSSISDLGAELQTPKRSLKRASNGTFTSDSGFDSGDESLAESIFSRRDGLESPASTIAPSPNMSQVALSIPAATHVHPTQKESRPAPTPASAIRQSTYDRVLRGLASTGIASSWAGNSSKCTICHGVPASEAWGVLDIIKEENRGLKLRVSELELVVDDCLSLVGP